jgi:hypothetical protein
VREFERELFNSPSGALAHWALLTSNVRFGVGGGAPMGAAAALSGDQLHAAYATLARDRDLLVEKLVEANRVHKATSAVRAVGPPPPRYRPSSVSLSRRATVRGRRSRNRAARRVMWHVQRAGHRLHGSRLHPHGREHAEPPCQRPRKTTGGLWVAVADVAADVAAHRTRTYPGMHTTRRRSY